MFEFHAVRFDFAWRFRAHLERYTLNEENDLMDRNETFAGKLNLRLVALSLVVILSEACFSLFWILIGLEAVASIYIMVFERRPIARAWAVSFFIGIAVIALVAILCALAACLFTIY